MAQVTREMAFNQSCYGLRSKSKLPNAYIFYVLRREIDQLKSRSTGSKFKAITIKTFDEVKLPVPTDSSVIEEVVRRCEAIDASAARIVAEGVPVEKVRLEMARRRNKVLAVLLDSPDISAKNDEGEA